MIFEPLASGVGFLFGSDVDAPPIPTWMLERMFFFFVPPSSISNSMDLSLNWIAVMVTILPALIALPSIARSYWVLERI